MSELPAWVSALPALDRDAYADGYEKGHAHAAYVDAYAYDSGDLPLDSDDTRPVPDRFAQSESAAMRWGQGWSDGEEAYAREQDESEHFPDMLTGELDRLELSGDERAVYAEVLTARHENREVSDACARVVANWFHGGQRSPGYAFVSTGAIGEDGPTDLWRATGGRMRDEQDPWMRDALDAFGTYLVRRWNTGNAGPVDGWSSLWVR